MVNERERERELVFFFFLQSNIRHSSIYVQNVQLQPVHLLDIALNNVQTLLPRSIKRRYYYPKKIILKKKTLIRR